ncbi:HAD-IIIC family phosphatase [Nocardia suismassiliense]|uniref:HAD-IIIC family phosphatase n=1 Tax=Nocardia suismassiliense TaxID=2077092 RepID=A0ABW6QZX4_9NOCA
MDDLLDRVRRLIEPGAEPDPALLAALAHTTDIGTAREAGRLLARTNSALVCRPGTAPHPLRVAVAGSFTADNLIPLLRISLLAAGIDPEFHLTPPDQLLMQLSDPDSALARFAPDLTVCPIHEELFLPRDADTADLDTVRDLLTQRLDLFGTAVSAFAARTAGTVLVHTVPLPQIRWRTVNAYRSRARLGRAWRELNSGLLEFAERIDNVDAVDLELLLTDSAVALRDDRLFRFGSMAWSPAVEQLYAGQVAGYARALTGRAKKCLVLDLDNTLWGGVLGDDGPENIELGSLYPGNAYTELQRAVLALRDQGVLLAVASKNDPALVARVLTEHPEMLVRTDDFVTVKANWEPKDGSLAAIAAELNLGLDSLVFADDSAFECELVGRALPQVTVVPLAGDPAGHLGALLAGDHFTVLTTTDTDRQRTELYRARVRRQEWTSSRSALDGYLTDLGIEVTVRRADEYLLPRIVQLGGRTNQFNLTGRAHTAQQTRRMAGSAEHAVLGFEVSDRFGREGMVGALWIAKHTDHWLIENAVLSCRVFARGIEFAVLQTVIDEAVAAGVVRLEAAFRSSGRNGPAEKFLADAGFVAADREPDSDGSARRILPLDPRPALSPAWISVHTDEWTKPHA